MLESAFTPRSFIVKMAWMWKEWLELISRVITQKNQDFKINESKEQKQFVIPRIQEVFKKFKKLFEFHEKCKFRWLNKFFRHFSLNFLTNIKSTIKSIKLKSNYLQPTPILNAIFGQWSAIFHSQLAEIIFKNSFHFIYSRLCFTTSYTTTSWLIHVLEIQRECMNL